MSGWDLLPATQVVMGSHSNCGTSRAVQRVLCGPGQGAAVPGAAEGGYWSFQGSGLGRTSETTHPVVSTLTGHQHHLGEGAFQMPAPKASDVLIQ